MAARYMMDRAEVAKLLDECKLLGCIEALDATADRILFAANGGSEADAMVDIGGTIALWSRDDNGFIAVADLKPLDGAAIESFGRSGKPLGIPIEPTHRFAAVSLAKAFPEADETKWKKLMRLGGCRRDRITRGATDYDALLAKLKAMS
ncbi:MAG: hypothetical protein EXQ95_14625 [Alphaproteobacteria bacterium]|nr:hypothetical protein [Alphaproteobacteria bacterium]